MRLSTRQRWMLYAIAALLTGAAMLAVQPPPETPETAVVAAPPRPSGAPAATPIDPAAPALALSPRPYGGAGRSPFGDASPQAATAGAQAFVAAPPVPTSDLPPPSPPTAATLPFRFLGRWIENGTTTVFLAHGSRQLAAVAGQPLTSDYRVEHIGERTLRLVHVPTGTRHALALVAGPAATAGAAGPAPATADTEEQN